MRVLPSLLVVPLLVQAAGPGSGAKTLSPVPWRLHLLDASLVSAKKLVFEEKGLLPGDGGARIPYDQLYYLSGPGRVVTDPKAAVVDLVDGSRLVGTILGGDEEGESLELKTSDFGVLQVSLDLVDRVRFRREGRLPRFPAVEGGGGETLLRWSPLGSDAVGGFLASVSREGLLFSVQEDEDPSLVPWKEVAGLRFDNEIPKDEARFALVGQGGSLLRVARVRQVKASLALSHPATGQLSLPLERLVTLVPLRGGGRGFATRLPVEFEEKSFFGKDGAEFGFQKNRNLFGDLLVSEGKGYPLGFAAHSWSRLSFAVPKGATRFRVFLGIDQTAREFPVPGNLDGRILVDGKPRVEAKRVQGGQPLRRLLLQGLKEGQKLSLELDFGENLHIGDRGDWILPVFLP